MDPEARYYNYTTVTTTSELVRRAELAVPTGYSRGDSTCERIQERRQVRYEAGCHQLGTSKINILQRLQGMYEVQIRWEDVVDV